MKTERENRRQETGDRNGRVYWSAFAPRLSPWGQVDQCEEILPGIWRVHTASHGGIMLSPERYEAMPDDLRCHPYGGHFNGWACFEEDCEAMLPLIAFRHELLGTRHERWIRKTFEDGMLYSSSTYNRANLWIASNQFDS